MRISASALTNKSGTLKGLLAAVLIAACALVPVGRAVAADLAFPILFVPLYSQNEAVGPGGAAFSDTRITIFNPSQHCGPFEVLVAAICGAGSPIAPPVGTVFDVRMFFFDEDENLVAIPSISMTPFDVEVVTGPTIPDGTGTAILVNLLGGSGIPIVALLHPLSAVVEIGAKLAAVNFNDPAAGPPPGPPPYLFAVSATEAQLIPAISGEFARVEVTTAADGSGVLFGPGFETVIVETCLTAGIINNFIVDEFENKLFDNHIPCTGLNTIFGVTGPDLLIWTPDDGGLLGTGVTPPVIGTFAPGYNRLAIDVDAFAPLTFFHGMAIVVMPGAETRQAYSYNMHANYFLLTALQAPTASTQQEQVAGVMGEVNAGVNAAVSAACVALAQLGSPQVETDGGGTAGCDTSAIAGP